MEINPPVFEKWGNTEKWGNKLLILRFLFLLFQYLSGAITGSLGAG